MSSYAYGEPVTLTLTDANGATASLSSYAEVVLTIVQPDGTSVTLKKSDSTLTANPYVFAPAQTGRHVYYYVTTTPNGATVAQPFDVEAAGSAALVSLADVKTELNIDDTSQDVELQGFIDAATDIVEEIVGPVRSTAYTETHPGYSPTVVLDRYPVISVDTVTEYDSNGTGTSLADEPLGSTYTDLGYRPDLTIGTLTRTSGGAESKFKTQITVTYTAGRTSVPPAVRLGTLELIRHMWETQRGESTGRPVPGYDTETPPELTAGYLIPNRVQELLAPYRKAPVV